MYAIRSYYDHWSDWNKETFKEYTSLVEGEYEFKVRSKDVFGNISEEASVITSYSIHYTKLYERWPAGPRS